MLVSHFTNTQAGYKLSFGGGTAVITDTTASNMVQATVPCDGNTVSLKLNKKMLCSSLAADGSDFELQGFPQAISGATGVGCATGFDFDSVVITLSNPLANGNYQLVSKTGSDGNTLLDICSTPMAVGLSAGFEVLSPIPATMAFADTIRCAPNSIRIRFSDPVVCNSLSPNGSDFSISGPQQGLRITGVSGSCQNGVAASFTLQLSEPITIGGTYTIGHIAGADNNTSLSTCGLESLPQAFDITVADKVNANFTTSIASGCDADSVLLSHPGYNNPNTFYNYYWSDGIARGGNITNRIFTEPGSYQVKMVVSNGICADSTTQTVNLTNTRVKAAFSAPAFACPGDTVAVNDSSTGPVTNWQWSYGDGSAATGQNPAPHRYGQVSQNTSYNIRLLVSNSVGCVSEATKIIEVANTCFIAVPGAFTPNGDGLNDILRPLNAYKATNLRFRVYNRYGQLVFETADWTRGWNGRLEGNLQSTGTYVWQLHYELEGRKFDLKGTAVLIR